jgi:hypothetical protein
LVVGVSKVWLFAVALAICFVQFAWAAASEDGTYEDSDAIFESLHKSTAPDTGGESIEDVLSRMFPDAEVDEGSYAPSEIWSHDLDLRRVKPPTLGYSGRVFGKYSKDEISGVTKWERELELTFNYGDWDANFRVGDYQPFADKQDPMRFEKARLRYQKGNGRYTVGSLGAVFGRGLALNLIEDRPVDFDNEVEGVKVEYTLGKTELTALWGTRKDRGQRHNSQLEAARVAFPVGNDMTIGAHVVKTKFPDFGYTPTTPTMLDYDVYGGDVTLRKGPMTFYGETARLKRSAQENASETWDMEGREGKAYYMSLGFSWPGFAITGEYKDYQGMNHPFNVLPPLRRFYESAKAEPNDDKGYLVSATWVPSRKNDATFMTTYGQSNPHEQVYPYTEWNLVYTSRSDRKFSWAPEIWRIDLNSTIRYIGRLNASRRLNDDWTVSAFYEHERWNPVYSAGFTDFTYEGEIAYQSKLNLTFTQEEAGTTMQGGRSYWKLWELKIKPDDRQEINIVKGARRAGYVCSGGVCRQEPEFSGLRVDYVFRF